MKTGKLNGQPEGSDVRIVAVADGVIGCPGNRRARLMSASALAGGTLRYLAVAAGMVTVFGTPAAGQIPCVSNILGTLTPINCSVIFGGTTTAFATAIGFDAVINGIAPTAYGGFAEANGNFATALGEQSKATGANATATGSKSTANGANATASGQASSATGDFATATGQNSHAIGSTASAYGDGSSANGDDTTAIGQASTASATGATALGQGTTASGARAFAGGIAATASGASAVALGDSASSANGHGRSWPQLGVAQNACDRHRHSARRPPAAMLPLSAPATATGDNSSAFG